MNRPPDCYSIPAQTASLQEPTMVSGYAISSAQIIPMHLVIFLKPRGFLSDMIEGADIARYLLRQTNSTQLAAARYRKCFAAGKWAYENNILQQ
ncbi:MAG: hypothetical protein H7Y86_21660 [Rhizobacter sp.]|nr:hypothetical protein [Ferruginibacter sp.]